MSSLIANIAYQNTNYDGSTGNVTGDAVIFITDAATGQPANGNNCVVNYTKNINGSLTTNNVTVPGTSYLIYSGQIGGNGFNATFTVNSITPGTGIPNNPATDDLQLVFITTTPESVIGADDGTVTITASSSFGPIQYSIDNITFQTDPVFNRLPSGAGTAWVKDANGGLLLSKPYTVGLIGNVLQNDPGVNFGNGNISNWNAAFNPVYFTFQRKDFEVTGIGTGISTDIVVFVNADIMGVSVGDSVYLNTAKYKGTFPVTGVSNGVLTVTAPYIGDDGGGFVNINTLKPYYQIQLKITYVDQINGQLSTLTAKANPDTTGFCRADLSNFLQTLLQATDKSDYTQVNYRDMQLSASYQVQYAETWTGATVNWISIARPYYVLFAAKQLQEIGGGNLQEYVPFALGYQPAKWVTDFTMPVYTQGFPFDIGFIFSEYMVGLAPFYNIVLLDVNKNPLSDQSVNDAFLLNEDGSFSLNQDASKFIIASQSISNVPIVEQVGLNRLLFKASLPDNCYYFSVQIRYTDSTPTTYNLTKKLICRVNQDTTDRQVYLRWIGLSGSWEYWTFAYNQVVSLDVTNPIISKNYVVDWANADTVEDVISKNAGQKMSVFGENVSSDDIKGLQSIKYSAKVQMLVNPSPIKWQTVIVAAGSFTERETMLDAYSVSLTFALPTLNIQTQ